MQRCRCSSTFLSRRNAKTFSSANNQYSQELPPCPSTFPPYSTKEFFHFEVLHQSKKSNARVGKIHTPHGIIDTPGFVAVGTNGALKAVSQQAADDASLQLMFANTYHLLVQPGPEIIAKAGGLHKFMNRNSPIITDSGGFQVFSLAYGTVHEELNQLKRAKRDRQYENAVKVSETGVSFKSYLDGKNILLTPESSVQMQKTLGADIIIPLDELPPYHISESELRDSVNRTHRWEARSLKEHLKNISSQAMYGVLHGGVDKTLRMKSLKYLTSLPFDGYAIGGSIGKDRKEMLELLSYLLPELLSATTNVHKPNHLLGIADPNSIADCIPLGIDTFDSCYPTRAGRNGKLFTTSRLSAVQVKAGKYRDVFEPVDFDCNCPLCTKHSLAYLHHLFKANEPNALVLASTHNIHAMTRLMKQKRLDILNGLI